MHGRRLWRTQTPVVTGHSLLAALRSAPTSTANDDIMQWDLGGIWILRIRLEKTTGNMISAAL